MVGRHAADAGCGAVPPFLIQQRGLMDHVKWPTPPSLGAEAVILRQRSMQNGEPGSVLARNPVVLRTCGGERQWTRIGSRDRRSRSRAPLKEAVGKVVGYAKLESEGKADKAQGKVQNAISGLKDAVRDAVMNRPGFAGGSNS